MTKTLMMLALGGLTLGGVAFAQDKDAKKAEGKDAKTVTKEVIIEQDGDGPKTGVVILKEGDGPPNVMILEGDDLDDLELDLEHDLEHPGAQMKGRMKLNFGSTDGKGGDFEFSFDGPPDPEQLKKIQERVRAHLKKAGIDREFNLPMLDPAKRAEWAKKAKARRAKAEAARLARQRAALLKEMKVGAEESAVVGPLLEKVLVERRALARKLSTARRALVKQTRATTDLVAAKKLVADYRTQRTQDGGALSKAQEELRGLLTIRQEALLVARDLLD